MLRGLAANLQWWLSKLVLANGSKRILEFPDRTQTFTDSSSFAAGAFRNGDCFYTAWLADDPKLQNEHINTKELAITVWTAICC